MDPRELESLSRRLIQNPHDQEALLVAHQAGQSDPSGYAMFLEKVGNGTAEPSLSCHWLTEAANVWLSSLNDAPRAARVLMKAIERDPTQPAPGERLAELYRERGDTKALVALLERRCKAIDGIASSDPAVLSQAAAMREELGRLWSEPPLSQVRKAIENYKRAIDLDSRSQYAIYALRELLKAEQAWADAVPYFELEQRLVDDPERKLALYQDEAMVRQSAGDRVGASDALRRARQVEGGTDPGLKQLLATMTLERVQLQEPVADAEREEAAQLFVELAEEYPGEHGLSYSACSLEVLPIGDRAVQLVMYYAEELGRDAEVVRHVAGYLKANPSGALAAQAREFVNKLAQSGVVDESIFEALAPTADAPTSERVAALLDQATALARRARKPEAAEKYQQILELDPANEEAVQFMEAYLRQRRKYAEMREMFRAAAAVADAPFEIRKQWYRELAGLCETQLRDVDGAVKAWQDLITLDSSDNSPEEQLERLLEKANRWDELVGLLERQAGQEEDIERRVAMERAIAKIHEQKRRDPVATGQTWARIAALLPDDESAIQTAVKNFERAERSDLAAQCITENVGAVSDENARSHLYEKLGALREAQGDWQNAGEAYSMAASFLRTPALFLAAEKCFVEAQAWSQAATVVDDLAQQTSSPVEQAKLFATVAVYLTRAGDGDGALQRLEQASDLDSSNDAYAEDLERIYAASNRQDDIVRLLLGRADRMRDGEKRVALRRRASSLQREQLGDPDAARATLLLVLTDGDDVESLQLLAVDAEQRREFQQAADYFHRLAAIAPDKAQKIEFLTREARIIAEDLADPEGAIERYEYLLKTIDPANAVCLDAIANLYEALDNPKGVVEALERSLALKNDPPRRLELASRLADLYESRADDPKRAIAMLDIVRELDEENFEALGRLCDLSEKVGDFARLAKHLTEQIAVEGDEAELSRIARKLAKLYHEKLGKSDEALSVLMQVADMGDADCREQYVALGDSLGWKGIVATKLIEWNLESQTSDARNAALRGAFERFLDVGREADAASVAKELIRARAADVELSGRLERIAVKLKDLDTLSLAHDLLVRDLSGAERAEEMVRQAEVLIQTGVEVAEAIQHGEQALTSVGADEVEPLLSRLANLTQQPEQVIDLYERQVTRCKAPADRLRALARAAQVAAERGSIERARTFFDIGLGGAVHDETMALFVEVARKTDAERGDQLLRKTLAEAFASGGQGSKDGGRTRSLLLRRAAQMAFVELKDRELAFQWLADSIVTHVDDEGLDDLERIASEIGEVKRAEGVLGKALEEVFDGPLVRKLLARRAKLRRERLDNKTGAAQDLKRLHDLMPSDPLVIQELTEIYDELSDHRGLVQLLEDQILRGKDPVSRAELARRVARIWEEQLGDAREAADAWRRVLRLKQGDPEAAEGLDRAKSNMLKRSVAASAEASAPAAASSPVGLEAVAVSEVPAQSAVEQTSQDEDQRAETAEQDSAELVESANGSAEVARSQFEPEERLADDSAPAVGTVSGAAIGIHGTAIAPMGTNPEPLHDEDASAIAPLASKPDLMHVVQPGLAAGEVAPPPKPIVSSAPPTPPPPPRAGVGHPARTSPPVPVRSPGSQGRPPPPPPPSGRPAPMFSGAPPKPPAPPSGRVAPPPPPPAGGQRRPPPPQAPSDSDINVDVDEGDPVDDSELLED
jgi:cellulose synthase operon protein C